MRYLNRLGEDITEAEWRLLSRNPYYCTVDVARGAVYVVKACWLGVASDCESQRRPFLLVASNVGGADDGEKEVASNEKLAWFATEQELLATFQRWKKICFQHGKVPAQCKQFKEST